MLGARGALGLTLIWLAAALRQTGRVKEAKRALAKAIAAALASFEMFVCQPEPWHRPENHALTAGRLHKAGWQG